MVPRAVIELNEPHATLGEASRQQTIRGVGAGLSRIGAVQLEGAFRFFRQIGQLGHRGLHAKRHFILRDPRGDLRIVRRLEFELVQFLEIVDEPRPLRLIEARRVGDIQHRVAHRAQLDPLIPARNESRAPLSLGQRLAVPRNHHDEGGQVLVDRPQPVGDPRAKARPSRQLKPGLRKRHRRIVIDLFGMHRLDEAQVVGDLRRCTAAIH